VAFSNVKLTDTEIKTLEEVEIGWPRSPLSGGTLDSLIRWGLVKETTGGLMLTPLGKFRLKVRR